MKQSRQRDTTKAKGPPLKGRKNVAATPDAVEAKLGHVVLLTRELGEDPKRTMAKSVLDPATTAAGTLYNINRKTADIDVNAIIAELQSYAATASSGDLSRPEAMLVSQGQTLHALFHAMIYRANVNMAGGSFGVGETYMRLGLKAQNQCRSTVETLAEMKNPHHVAFVKQANIANGPQQVNNGSQARKTEIQPNKLLEGERIGERMDTGAKSEAGGANQELEALGAIDGAANNSGKGAH